MPAEIPGYRLARKRGTETRNPQGELVFTAFELRRKTGSNWLGITKSEPTEFVLLVYNSYANDPTNYLVGLARRQTNGSYKLTSDDEPIQPYDVKRILTAGEVARRHVKKLTGTRSPQISRSSPYMSSDF